MIEITGFAYKGIEERGEEGSVWLLAAVSALLLQRQRVGLEPKLNGA